MSLGLRMEYVRRRRIYPYPETTLTIITNATGE
jgi:hypothetical protein